MDGGTLCWHSATTFLVNPKLVDDCYRIVDRAYHSETLDIFATLFVPK